MTFGAGQKRKSPIERGKAKQDNKPTGRPAENGLRGAALLDNKMT